MDTERLRYFVTIVRTGSLHRASELLRLSPAALSKSMKLLESEFNTQLFIRSGRGILVTDAGKALSIKSEKLLIEFDALKGASKLEASNSSSLRLGSFEVFTTHFLAPLTETFSNQVDLTLHELTPGKLEQAILDNEVDIGVSYIPVPHAELDFLKVSQLTMNVYVRKTTFQKLGWNELPFAIPVTPIHGSPTKVVGLDGWPDNLYPRKIKYRVTLMESALELTRLGIAACYIPEFVARLHNQKVKESFQLVKHPDTLPLPQRFTHQHIYIIKRKSQLESDTIKKLAKTLRMVCASH